jgi:3-deoxy-manno-octulosonate cytidylyltransferase (CMP-KDO synthetase)
MKIICVIPARYKSSRFPGKSIYPILGKPLIYWVWKNAVDSNIFDEIYIATDDKRIYREAKKFGAKSIMTSNKCKTCSDRVYEVSNKISANIYINLQGDEPLISPETIREFTQKNIESFSLSPTNGYSICGKEDINNPNVPKVIIDTYEDLIYISRFPIPYKKKNMDIEYYKQLGIYGYTKDNLINYTKFKRKINEISEEIDVLRFIENGFKVRMIKLKLPKEIHAVDILKDIKIVEGLMNEAKMG